MIDLFLWLYFTIGGLCAIWLIVRFGASMKTKREIAHLAWVAFFLWPVIWSGVAWDWMRARWRRRSLVIR